ncbi:MAG: hypothetical protein JJU11_04920 [Candidatus Sumerlaeia bacterium]|nr:hypothetical protein [Candidatus Sumerlaeia bacterium]
MKKNRVMSLPMIALMGLFVPIAATASVLLLQKTLEVMETRYYDEVIDGGNIFREATISEDGSLLLVSVENGAVAYDTTTGDMLWEWEEPHFNLNVHLMSGDGSRIARGFEHTIIDARTGLVIRHEPDERTHLLAFSRDGSTLAYVKEGILHVEETDTGTSLFEHDLDLNYSHLVNHLRSATFSESGSRLAFHSRFMDTLFIVDLDSGTIDEQPGPDHYFGALATSYSPQLDRLAYEDVGVGAVVMEYPGGLELLRHEFDDHLYDMRFSPDGELLHLTLGHPTTTTFEHKTVEIATGEVLNSETRTRGELLGVYTKAGEPHFMESWKDSIRFLDAAGTDDLPGLAVEYAFNLRLKHFQGGQKVLVVDAIGQHTILDRATGDKEPWKPLPWSTGYYSIAVAGGSDIAVMHSARAMISYDLTTREPLHTLRELIYTEASILDISHDGTIAALGVRGEEEVALVNPRTNETVGSIAAEEPVFALALSRDGEYLALFHSESVSVFETATGDIRHSQSFLNSFNPHQSPPPSSIIFHKPLANIAISPDGDHVALFTERTTLWHLDMVEGTQIPIANPDSSHENTSLTFALSHLHLEFSPDGHRLLVSPRMLDLFRQLFLGSQHMRGTVLVDLRNYDKVRGYLVLAPGDPIPGPAAFESHRMAEATFSPDGREVWGLDWKSNSIFVHESGIEQDDVDLVIGNLLSLETRLPGMAPGVDVSGDGVLDAADIIEARN